MAIKFEDDKGGLRPGKKEVGGKAHVSEAPAASPEGSEPATELPFAKPVRPEKKPRKPLR